jgi:hypothetical protein
LTLAVAVSLHPDWYSGGERSPDGSPWEILGVRYDTNPRLQLKPEDGDMIRLWRLYQGGMNGVGHLPDGGGTLDQPALMLDAFGLMTVVEQQLKPDV